MKTFKKYLKYIKQPLKIACIMSMGIPLAHAATFPLNGSDVVGSEKYVVPQGNETLLQLARDYDVGYEEIIRANPHVNSQSRLSGGRVFIPSRFVLPPGPRHGIVINLAELRLYYFPPGKNVVVTKPIGIGREGWQTPTGVTRITAKEKDPYWYPTPNVRAEAARHGTPIPEVFPPGPDNPLGNYKMRLQGPIWSTILIHGTNRPEYVGSRVSAGCIRLMPEDIEEIFHMVPVGTEVRVINQPFKAGWANGQLYFEAHYPLAEEKEHYAADMTSVVKAISSKTAGRHTTIKWSLVQNAAKRPNGIPQVVSN